MTRMLTWLAAALVLVLATGPAQAQSPGDTVAGPATAESGNKLIVDGTSLYLAGIQAPEPGEKCRAGSLPWYCGKKARETLNELVHGRRVSCEIRFTPSSTTNPDRDANPNAPLPRQRPGAVCETDAHHLNATLVSRGLAAPRSGSEGARYRRIAEKAKAADRGIWQGS